MIIAEKPSAAKAIADALGGFTRREGYLENESYYLSWAVGHLVELMAPEEYDPRWKRWTLDTLPILPATFGLKVSPKTRAQFQVLAELARKADSLINACDAAREGELIFRYIIQAAGVQRKVERLWVSALTRDAIRRAFTQLRPASDYDRLYHSALCRSQGDWLVGMNATRAFTVKWGELLPVGRVQTPTLSLLVRREREIAAFVPEQYWQVEATFATAEGTKYTGRWYGAAGDRLATQTEADQIAERTKNQPGKIETMQEAETRERPPLLYDLTALQREANRRFGLTAASALKAAQSLYEQKLITYPRTDSRYLNRDLLPGLPAVVRQLTSRTDVGAIARGADLKRVHGANRRVVDDAKVTDHHAIIPTPETAGTLKGMEAKIYDLIARRFLAQFYPDATWHETEVITQVGDLPDRFRTKGRRMLEPGWRVVEPEPVRKKGKAEEEEDLLLPALTQGDGVRVCAVDVCEKQTQPPKRYTEALLLGAMESAGKAMDDESLKEAMKGRGLGTPATRASIIERLKDVGYIAVEQKALVPTAKGHRLVELAEQIGAQVLLSPEMTGEWEKRLADVQTGEVQPEEFMSDLRQLAATVVELTRGATGSRMTAMKAPGKEPTEGPTSAGKCPRCGRAVIKGAKQWACHNHACGLQIPTWLCGKVIDLQLAQALLQKGRTPLITGFKSPRTGKTFQAYLVWQSGKVGFEFPPDKPRKASGYRRSGVRENNSERANKAETGPRTAGRGAGRAGTRQK